MRPVVSVVIPTRSRPQLLVRAVRSVLAQTFADLEVIVVVDGPDETTVRALESLDSEWVRILELNAHVGGSEARNIGVRAARGEWIAFLDDDDEWLPEKLERQFSALDTINVQYVIATSAVTVQQGDAEYIWPRQAPFQPLSEYLFARNSLYQGEGVLPIITWLVSRGLFEKVEFRSGLRKHQDWDWLIRAAALPGVQVKHVPEPLAIWHLDHNQTSVSRTQNYQASLEWIRSVRPVITRRAYAGFLATQVGAQAARQGKWSVLLPTLVEMFRFGSPRIIDLSLMMGMWFVPPKLRTKLRRRATRNTSVQSKQRSYRPIRNSKLLTVGLPVHNAMPYLPESIGSLLSQSDPDFQIIAVDDGSTDGSLEYLKSINDSRLRVIPQSHRKLTSTLNRLLVESESPWLIRHDADDIAAFDRIAIVRQAVAEHPTAGMFYSNARYYQPGQAFGTFRTTKASPEELRRITSEGRLLSLCHPTVTLNVAAAREVGGYRFDLHVEDIDLWWRMALYHDVRFIPEYTVYFRHNAGSVSTSNLEQQSINTLYVQYLLLSHLRGVEPLPLEAILHPLSRLLNQSKLRFREQMRCANIYAGSREYLRSVRHMLRAAVASPTDFANRVKYEFSSGQIALSGEDPEVFRSVEESLWPRNNRAADVAINTEPVISSVQRAS